MSNLEPANEALVLRLLEHALEMPWALRAEWIENLDVAADVIARLRHLLNGATVARALPGDPSPASALSPAMTLPRSGECVGVWRLQRELGSGGMGVVFLAQRDDGAYRQQVALKLMHGNFMLLSAAQRSDLLLRFDNERQMLAHVEHPNVARILDGGTTSTGMPWLAMEYIDGLPLHEYCETHALDLPARLQLLCKLCDGVQAAHRHLIVHRDLKPRNVLVDATGEPKLLDFGIARSLDADVSRYQTRTGMAMMTPDYASPEQLRLQPLTTASDVYSLGVIAYEIITGARPYSLDGLSPAQSEQLVCATQPYSLRRAILGSALPDPVRRARLARIGTDLERIVAKALHKEPPRRYGSAEGLADDLRRYLAGEPVQAHPDSARYRLGKFLRRHKMASAAAALALTAVLAAAAVALVQARQARQAAADTEQVNTFLLEILDQSSPYNSGSEITLAQALDDAAGTIDAHFRNRPDLAVGVRNSLAQSLYARGRLDAADKVAQRAKGEAERLFGGEDQRTVTAISILANVRKEQERDDESMQLFADAMQRMERSGQTQTSLYADLLNDLGVLHLAREEFAKARPLFERVLALDDAIGGRNEGEEHARTLGNLAHAERGLGHLDRADALYRQAQPILAAKYPDGGPHLAVVLNNRAKLARMRGDDAQALDLQKQAVAMHRKSFKGDHVMILVPLTNLATLALDRGDMALAERAAVEANAMSARLYPAGHAYRVNAMLKLADVRLAQGRNADALSLLRDAGHVFAGLDHPPPSTREALDRLRIELCAKAQDSVPDVCRTGATPTGT